MLFRHVIVAMNILLGEENRTTLQTKQQHDIILQLSFFDCPGYFVDAAKGILYSYHSYSARKRLTMQNLLPERTIQISCMTGKITSFDLLEPAAKPSGPTTMGVVVGVGGY